MRVLQVDVVAGAVQVHRQKIDRIEPVLLAVRLRLDQQHLLGKAVGRVGLFRVSVPKVVFRKRDRSEFRVGANRPHLHDFLDVVVTRLLDDLDAHDRVVIEERSRIVPVRSDAANPSGEVNDQIRPLVFVHSCDVGLLGQVVLGAREGEDLGLQRLYEANHLPAKKAVAPGHRDALSGPETMAAACVARHF